MFVPHKQHRNENPLPPLFLKLDGSACLSVLFLVVAGMLSVSLFILLFFILFVEEGQLVPRHPFSTVLG